MEIDHTRRRLLTTFAAAPAGVLFVMPALAATPARDRTPDVAIAPIRFAVSREGQQIGSHTVRFQREGADLIVEIDIELDVRFAFVTVYRYRHTNREVWRDGRVVAIDARTDDNGEGYTVTARGTAEGLTVEGREGRVNVPADTLSTSYWNPATVRQSKLIDTQHGRIAEVTTRSLGFRAVQTPAGTVRGECWRVSGDLDLDVCYAENGAWIGLDFEARGSRISYARADRPDGESSSQRTGDARGQG
ncbi:MAG: DUF6134 family protein [Alphaproteobacteria bacterium]